MSKPQVQLFIIKHVERKLDAFDHEDRIYLVGKMELTARCTGHR